MYEFYHILEFLLIALPLVFAVFLLTEKPVHKKVLGVYMACVSVFYFLGIEYLFTTTKSIEIGESFAYSILLTFFPFYYLYTKSLTTENFKFKKLYFLHYLPAKIVFAVSCFKLGFLLIDHSLYNIMPDHKLVGAISIIAYFAQFIPYTVTMILLFRKHSYKKVQHYSYDNKEINLKWLKFFLIAFITFWILDILMYNLISGILSDVPMTNIRSFYYIITTLFITFLAYSGLKQKTIFPKTNVVDYDKDINQCATPESENKKLLSEEKSKTIYSKLVYKIKEKKLFKNPNLSIYHLSEELKVNKTYLSYVINNEARVNFCTFINQFRLEYVKDILLDKKYENWTLSAISKEAGFNSLPSFNTWFKKLMGITPSQFRKGNK